MATVTITFETDNAAFEDEPELEVDRLLRQARIKVFAQLARAPGCVCTAPEAGDKLLDSNGNTVGKVEVQHGSSV